LQAVLSPAADLVSAAASTPPDQARTIIEVDPPQAMAGATPRRAAEPAAPAAVMPPATIQPAPIQPGPVPVAVSGSIQTPATPPAGMPAGSPRGSKPTVGPRAVRSPGGAVDPARLTLARLVSVNRDGTDGEIHAITEECFDLGRTAGHLVFNDDPYLSDRHCRFSIRNDRWLVQDLQSCNGVFLRVDKVELRDGDRLLLGKQVLSFEILGEHERALAPAVEHGVLVFGSPLRTPWGRLRQLTVAGIHRDVYYLYRPRLTIGREEGDWIFPDDEFMSRQHLSISLAGTRVELQDLQSSNGTFVQIREPHELGAGALIRVGDQLLRFEPV
jgi:pSer/pThr/pTyr-binding forkhead associated (FHA) protein